MKRREALKLAALATGATISIPLMSSLLSSCQAEVAKDDYLPQYFTTDEFVWVKDLVDVILPKTDSPSASEVGVHKIIDAMVGKVLTKEKQEEFRTGWTAMVTHLNPSKEGNGFQSLAANKKLELLQQLASSNDAGQAAARNAFMDLKGKTVAYYLSTEKIATTYLNYLPVPGKYEPCISVEEAGGKAWAI